MRLAFFAVQFSHFAGIAVAVVLLNLFQAVGFAADEPANKLTSDELLFRGRYREISLGDTVHAKAVWAFAQHHLAPSGKVYDVAWETHQKGNILGTFVAWQCQKEGIGARHDEQLMWQLHWDIRQRLEPKKDPTPIDLYFLAHLDPVDAKGVMVLPEKMKHQEFEASNRQIKRERLERSAKAGFAQACDKLAKEFQDAQDDKAALLWYEKAVELGHAGAMRSKGYFLMVGKGTNKNAKSAFEFAVRAAEGGDAFAMVNLAFYHHKGWGTDVDAKKAQMWLNKAAESGHWVGLIERGMARFEGMYGFGIDPKAGEEDLRQALTLRHREVLDYLTRFYAQGIGVPKDGVRAVHFAEAAFVQGSQKASQVLVYLYTEGAEGLKKDEKLKNFWTAQANPSFAFALGDALENSQPELTARLKKLDPWSWGK